MTGNITGGLMLALFLAVGTIGLGFPELDAVPIPVAVIFLLLSGVVSFLLFWKPRKKPPKPVYDAWVDSWFEV